jgi:hypothetical protein
MDVALATCRRLPEPDHDEAPLLAALDARGIEARVLAWDDADADFSQARITLLRSTWNYYRDIDAFLAWAERASEVSTLLNGLDVVRWDHDKRYLLELESRGIPIAPTERLERGDERMLADVLGARGWRDVVIKPSISAASFRTMRVRGDDTTEGEAHLRALLAERDVLVQRYIPSVEGHGERSLVWIDGEITHAVRKTPRFGHDEERVSDAVPIGDDERALAERAVATVPLELVYARVDVAPDDDGTPLLMELELMEPSLYFPQSSAALERMVDAIAARL